jgi:hypothetical protein
MKQEDVQNTESVTPMSWKEIAELRESLPDLVNPDVEASDWHWYPAYDSRGGAFVYEGPGVAKPLLRDSEQVLRLMQSESLEFLGKTILRLLSNLAGV